jgi:hypothetical protein
MEHIRHHDGVLVAAAVAYNMPDLIRYIRIRNM